MLPPITAPRRCRHPLAALFGAVATLALPAAALRAADLDVEAANSPYLLSADATYGNVYVGLSSNGILNQASNLLTVTSQMLIGSNSHIGIYNLTGTGRLSTTASVYLGVVGGASNGIMNLGGSAQFNGVDTFIGYYGSGTVNQSGTSLFSTGTGALNLSYLAGSLGVYNLDGGTLSTTAVVGDAAGGTNSTFNFNGGTLRAVANQTNFIQGVNTVNVRNGGAIFDTQQFNVSVNEALKHSGIPGDAATDGGLTKVGLGTLTLGGTNTFNGGLTINGGRVVALNNGSALGSGPVVIASGATAELSNTGAASTNIAVAGGTSFLGAGTLVKSGTGAIQFGGGGSVTVALSPGARIDVQAGTLFGAANNNTVYNSGGVGGVGNQAALNVASGATFDGVEGAVRVDALTGAGTLQGGYAGQGSVTLGVAGGSGTFTGTLADSGNMGGRLTLTKAGAGTQALGGTGSYTGATTVTGGTLTVGSGGSLGATNITVGAGAAFNVTGTGALASTTGSLLVNGTATLASTAAQSRGLVSVGDAPGSVGSLTQTAGAFTTNGNFLSLGNATGSSGTYSLGGGSLSTAVTFIGNSGSGTFNEMGGSFTTNYANLYLGFQNSGSTGTFNLGGSGSLSTGAAFVGDNGNGTFNQTGGSFTTNGYTLYVGFNPGTNNTFNLSGGTLTTGNIQVSDDNNTSVFNQSGGTVTTGPMSLSGYSTNSRGIYNLNGGTLVVSRVTTGDGGTSGTSTFNFNGGVLQSNASNATFFQGLTSANVQAGGARVNTNGFNVTIAQALTHDPAQGSGLDGGLTKLGAGTLTLSGVNTYTGGTTIRAGTLAVAADSALGAVTGDVTVTGSGALSFTGSPTVGARNINLGTSTLATTAGNTLTFSGTAINGGFLGTGGTVAFGDGSALNGTTTALGSALTTDGAVTFTNATLRGATTVNAGSTLAATNTVVSSAGSLTVNGTVNAAGLENDGVMHIPAGGTIANTGTSLVLGGGSRTYIGTVAAPGGTLSTPDGVPIAVNGGLLVNNGTVSGEVDAYFGALVKGAGTFGAVKVADGGVFSPGNSPGTATVGSLDLQSGGKYQFEINSATAANNAPGNGADLINDKGVLTLSAGTTANSRFVVAIVSLDGSDSPAALTDFDASKPYKFTLVTAAMIAGYSAGEFAVDASGFQNGLQGGSFAVVQDGNNLDLLYTPAPEPGTWALLVAGGVAGLAWRRMGRAGRAGVADLG